MLSFFSYRRPFATALGNKLFQSLVLFAVIFGHVYWLTPISPTASLTVADTCGFLAISADNKSLITAGTVCWDGSRGPIQVWDVEEGQERFSVAHDWRRIYRILLSSDGKILAAHKGDGDLKMWEVLTGRELATVITGGSFANFCFTPDGASLAISNANNDPGVIKFLDTKTHQERTRVEGQYWAMAFSQESKSVATANHIAGENAWRVRLWRLDWDELPVLVMDISITANEIVFAPDLKTFASIAFSDGTTKPAQISLWRMATGAKLFSLDYKEVDIAVWLAYAAKGKMLTARCSSLRSLSYDLPTTVWDVTAQPNKIATFNDVPCISSDGLWFAIPKGDGAELRKLDTVQTHANLSVYGDLADPDPFGGISHTRVLPTITFSPDCNTAAVGPLYYAKPKGNLRNWLPRWVQPFFNDSHTSVYRLWDLASAKELFAFYQCSQLAFSPDGKMLATLQDDKTVKLWRLPLCKPMARILAPQS